MIIINFAVANVIIMQQDTTPQYHVTITKEEVSRLPQASMRGFTKVIDRHEDVAAAVEDLKQCDVIGFDTETRPTFTRGKMNYVSLMQFATHDGCYLFRLNRIGLCKELVELLESPKLTKVGLSVHDDFLNLSRLDKICPKGFIDLQKYVKNYKISDNALQRIYAILFGERISKGQRLTNWEADKLTDGQIKYAALDALACLQIYDYLNSGIFLPDKSPYYREIEIEQETTTDINNINDYGKQ